MNSSARPATSEELDFLSVQKNSQFRETFLRLCQNKAAVAGMIFLVFLILLAVFADLLFDYQTTCVDLNIAERLQWPSAEHWFGTDQFGRDLLARVVHGSRVSLSIGFIAVAFGLVVGGILGAIAGFFGGAVDNVIMRLCDVFLAVPMMLMAIATSIDALAVGITFAFLQVNVLAAVSFIGVTTFLLSALGVRVGNLFGARYKSMAELIGGIILILLGTQILLEHLGVL